MSEYLSKKAVLEWLESEMSTNKGHPDDIDIHWTLNRVSKKILSGAFDAEQTCTQENPCPECLKKSVDGYKLIESELNTEIQRLRAALVKARQYVVNGYELGYIDDREGYTEALVREIDKAFSTTTELTEAWREICPDHSDEKPQISSSHTWTQDGNTYFVSYVEYCPTCYHVISTSARL